jgi:hypothetical protein
MNPEWITTVWLRVKTLFRRRQLSQDLDDELQFHMAMPVRERMEQRGSCGSRSKRTPRVR